MSDKYILAGHVPVRCESVQEWGQWFETHDRKVGHTVISDTVYVSTVFLGIDHSFGADGPLLFETMIFGGEHDQWQDRYETWAEAEAGHHKAVALATGLTNGDEAQTPPAKSPSAPAETPDMGFCGALEMVVNGIKVRRREWPDGYYLAMHENKLAIYKPETKLLHPLTVQLGDIVGRDWITHQLKLDG
jgi:hypothetical protein